MNRRISARSAALSSRCPASLCRYASTLTVAAIAALASSATNAQAYPVKPIRFMVPFAAGGLSDILGRVVAAKMGEVAGQTVIVENRGGAGGTIGAAIVAAAEPDGYMVMLSSLTTQAIAPHMLQKVPYSTLTAFTPVVGVARLRTSSRWEPACPFAA